MCELVDIDVGYNTIKGSSLDTMIRSVDDDEIRMISVVLLAGRTDQLAVAFVWRPLGDAYAEIDATDRDQVRRVADTLGEDVVRGRFLSEPLPGRRRDGGLRRLWLHELSIQVVGVVVGTGALTAIGVVWALLR